MEGVDGVRPRIPHADAGGCGHDWGLAGSRERSIPGAGSEGAAACCASVLVCSCRVAVAVALLLSFCCASRRRRGVNNVDRRGCDEQRSMTTQAPRRRLPVLLFEWVGRSIDSGERRV
jgi:hypothetical protein